MFAIILLCVKFLSCINLNSFNVSGKAPFDTVWIGLSDLQLENRFQWSDGTGVTYTNWQTQEPNNLGNEDCVEARIKVRQ